MLNVIIMLVNGIVIQTYKTVFISLVKLFNIFLLVHCIMKQYQIYFNIFLKNSVINKVNRIYTKLN